MPQLAPLSHPPLSAEEYLHLPPPERSELIDGEVVEMAPSGFEHSDIAAAVVARLRQAAQVNGRARVVGADCGFVLRRGPDLVRSPDAALILSERLPAGRLRGFFPGAPDLAVEVVSPFDRGADLARRVEDYLAAGTQEVWVLWPEAQMVHVYRATSPSVVRVVRRSEDLRTPLLPDLVIALEDIFEVVER